MLIVQLCDFGNDGDYEHRLHEPSRQLAKLAGVEVVDCHVAHETAPDWAERADVLIVQFFNDWELLSLCHRRRIAGKITVFEANDYFFDIQPWNPIASSWRDRVIQELYLKLLTAVDGVQTSCAWLADQWRRRGAKNVAIFQNHLATLEPLDAPAQRPLTIGWAGSPGHFADWFEVAPRLQKWLNEHREVHLAVMTNELAHGFFKLPAERYHFTPFGSHKDYMAFLRTIDIGIAPLLPNDYNRGRSDVKFVEYAAQGVAGIFRDLEPYRDSVRHGETGLLYRTTDELIACLETLASQPAMRQRLRHGAHTYVAGNRMIADRIPERLAWYRSLIGSSQSGQGGRTAGDARVGSGVNEEVRPGAPEKAYLRAMTFPKAQDVEPILAQVVASRPKFLGALLLRAKCLNDLRRFSDALLTLDAAKAIAPNSARAWSEAGRTHFLMGNSARAFSEMAEAIRLNPDYLPGWQYLLRLLLLAKDPEGEVWASRAISRFPDCYSVVLLAIDLLPPSKALAELHALLQRVATTFVPGEEAVAMPVFRKTIASLIAAGVAEAELIPTLRLANELFPQSAKLAAELANSLTRAGRGEESHEPRARAMALRMQAGVVLEEFSKAEAVPWEWTFSSHIVRCTNEPNTAV